MCAVRSGHMELKALLMLSHIWEKSFTTIYCKVSVGSGRSIANEQAKQTSVRRNVFRILQRDRLPCLK
jgi:hypothetical protein